MRDKKRGQRQHAAEQPSATDAVMQRQLESEHHCFRVMGELRRLLGAFSQEGISKEQRWQELRKRGEFTITDPALIDKVAAQRLLTEIYPEVFNNPEMARWLESRFSGIDPGDPTWLELKRIFDNKEDIPKNIFGKATEKIPSIIIFGELCHQCNDHQKTMAFLQEKAPGAVLSLALATPPVPPPSPEAVKQHTKKLDEDQEYRAQVESDLGMIMQAASKNPRIIEAVRESMKMTRFVGFPPDSKAQEHFAVAREEIDALLHAIATGKSGSRKNHRLKTLPVGFRVVLSFDFTGSVGAKFTGGFPVFTPDR